jgi:PKD repeat protein
MKPNRATVAAVGVTGLLCVMLAPAPMPAVAAGPASPPFTECPADGQDTSCGTLIIINPNGSTTVVSDPSQGPLDGIEDTLIGVVNNSSTTVQQLPISSAASATSPIFDFDGDGLCAASPRPTGCPFGPTTYEGPGISFTIADPNNGTVNFAGGLAPGASAYFSLEGAVTASSILLPRYVALGDSYQSGEGVPPFESGTDTTSDTCHRSTKAYQKLILGKPGVPQGVEFRACSGAVMSDFYNTNQGESPQLARLCASAPPGLSCNAGDTTATLVTTGVGGNDIGFDHIVRTCLDASLLVFFNNSEFRDNCDAVLEKENPSPTELIKGLTTGDSKYEGGNTYKLPDLFAQLRADAPLARVFVMGYPQLLPSAYASAATAKSAGNCNGIAVNEDGSQVGFWFVNLDWHIHQDQAVWLYQLENRLNAEVKARTMDAGFTFVDVASAFSGHDVCGNNAWAHGLVMKTSGSPSEFTFHPNAAGHRAFAAAATAAIADPSVTVFPGQTVQQSLAVGSGMLRLGVQARWLSGDVELSLVAPSGRVIGRNTSAPDVQHTLQPNSETFSVANPEPGNWTIDLLGRQVPASGEPVDVQTTQLPLSDLAPIASILPSTDRGIAPLAVHLDGSSSAAFLGATISSYSWSFGDHTPGTSGATADHTFLQPGLYPVTLTVTDSHGLRSSAEQDIFVSAKDQPPSAQFRWGANAKAPQTVLFDAEDSADIDGTITNFSWDFGDGGSSSGAPRTAAGVIPQHHFPSPGNYLVRLTATDNGGLQATSTQVVPVGTVAGNCSLCVLGRSGTTLSETGNASASVGGAVAVDSTGQPALTITGNGSLTATAVGVTGGASTGTAGVAHLTTGVPPVTDPLRSFAPPQLAPPLVPQSVTALGITSQAISPGVYQDITASDTTSLTLSPGTYVVTGSMIATGGAQISGKGVTVYLACSSYPAPCAAGQTGAFLSLSGNASPNLSAQPGSCLPVTLAADRNNTSALQVSGQATAGISGAVYAMAGGLSLTGNGLMSVSGGPVDVGQLVISGKATCRCPPPLHQPRRSTSPAPGRPRWVHR